MQNNTAVTRWVFTLISIFIISLIVWNTYVFFNQLKQNERNKMQIWAEAQKEINDATLANGDISITSIKVLESNATTPMISYNHKDSTYNERNIDSLAVNTDEKIQALIAKFTSEYKPIELQFRNKPYQTVYYGNSPIINKLKYYPAVLILIMLLFFTALYLFFKISKSSEQNKLWAGMAKETAHQIGTPLSSLVGWIELLKSENVNPDYLLEMEKDIDRLETITDRFSKVGSIPKLERKDLVEVSEEAFDYLIRRSSKLINFTSDIPSKPIYVNLNEQLYSWTIENLVKNGIDAMKGKGDIHVEIFRNKKFAFVQISDTGKGIPKRKQKQVFSPGFTTKRRGWGLGLSLAKRIIEEYHDGRIKVHKSIVGEGTIMEISLRLVA